MTDIGGATFEAQSRNMKNICTKYGFDSFIISGSYGGHGLQTTDDRRQTTSVVWHKLPTGELKIGSTFTNASFNVEPSCSPREIYR